MNKQYKMIIFLLALVMILTGIKDGIIIYQNTYDDELDKIITSHSWERDGGGDIETIYFTEEGEFGYYCSCGSPVDYYDLCDSYKYEKETNTIKLQCLPGVKVNKLKIIEYTKDKLVLDFEGEKREFITEYHHLIDNPLSFAGTKFRTPGTKEEIEIEFTKEGNFEAFNKTTKKYALGSEFCFTWEYNENKNEITLDCQDHTRKIQIKKYTPNQNEDVYPTELELYFEHENKTYYFTKIKDNE